jgi:hypothetical protein
MENSVIRVSPAHPAGAGWGKISGTALNGETIKFCKEKITPLPSRMNPEAYPHSLKVYPSSCGEMGQ